MTDRLHLILNFSSIFYPYRYCLFSNAKHTSFTTPFDSQICIFGCCRLIRIQVQSVS